MEILYLKIQPWLNYLANGTPVARKRQNDNPHANPMFFYEISNIVDLGNFYDRGVRVTANQGAITYSRLVDFTVSLSVAGTRDKQSSAISAAQDFVHRAGHIEPRMDILPNDVVFKEVSLAPVVADWLPNESYEHMVNFDFLMQACIDGSYPMDWIDKIRFQVSTDDIQHGIIEVQG